MYHYNWWSIFSETIVCITIGQQKNVCTITASFLFLRILTTNYSDTHHREITVNTREDATEITIPWFNTNLIFLQRIYIQEVDRCTAPNLTEAVCPLFEEYSRLSVTLENLSENDSLHTNLSLLVLVTRKVLIDFCKLKVS